VPGVGLEIELPERLDRSIESMSGGHVDDDRPERRDVETFPAAFASAVRVDVGQSLARRERGRVRPHSVPGPLVSVRAVVVHRHAVGHQRAEGGVSATMKMLPGTV